MDIIMNTILYLSLGMYITIIIAEGEFTTLGLVTKTTQRVIPWARSRAPHPSSTRSTTHSMLDGSQQTL